MNPPKPLDYPRFPLLCLRPISRVVNSEMSASAQVRLERRTERWKPSPAMVDQSLSFFFQLPCPRNRMKIPLGRRTVVQGTLNPWVVALRFRGQRTELLEPPVLRRLSLGAPKSQRRDKSSWQWHIIHVVRKLGHNHGRFTTDPGFRHQRSKAHSITSDPSGPTTHAHSKFEG